MTRWRLAVAVLAWFAGPGAFATAAAPQTVDVRSFGAIGDGSAGGGDGIQLAIDAAPPGGVVIIPAGSYNLTKTLQIADKAVTVSGAGQATVLWSGSPLPLIHKSGHGRTLRVEKVGFDAQHPAAVAILCENPTTTYTQSLDVWISDCSFTGNGSGVSLVRCREALIANSRFVVGRSGIVFRDASNPLVTGCFFSPLVENDSARGIFYNGDHASVFSAGLRVAGCTMMGLAVGVDVRGSDFFSLSASLVDYCDLPVRLVDQDGAVIQGNYIGARGNRKHGSSVGIEVRGEEMVCQHIKIVDNIVTTYDSTVVLRTGIRADGVHGLTITGNTVHFWNNGGIEHVRCERVTVERNTVLAAPGGTGAPVNAPTAGEAVIPSGESSVMVGHGLGVFPVRVFVTPDRPVPCGVIVRTDRHITIAREKGAEEALRVFWRVEGE